MGGHNFKKITNWEYWPSYLFYGPLLPYAFYLAIKAKSFGFFSAAMILLTVVGLPILYAFILYPKIGIIIFLFSAYFVMFIYRLDIGNYPYGTVMDFMELLLIIGFFIQQKQQSNWEIFKGPISTMILIWICYNLIEIVNPTAASILAWVYTVRSVAIIMLMYFVFLYNIIHLYNSITSNLITSSNQPYH